MQILKDFISVRDKKLQFFIYQKNDLGEVMVWSPKKQQDIPEDLLMRKIENISFDKSTQNLVVTVGEIVKPKKDFSNAKYYSCPLCTRMIPEETRRLDICRNCKSGDKFVKRNISKTGL